MESLANLIIRPERASYNPEKDLGPKEFILDGKSKKRLDFEITNEFHQKLKCSLFVPSSIDGKYPCVIYCHGNEGCRIDSLDPVDLLLPHDILLASLDFSGSGLSDGKFVTLGYNEKDDLKCLVKYLRGLSFVSDIGLWGRSMGASTSILYASKDPEIVGLCLDSPFSSLNQLATDIMNSKTLGFLFGGLFFGSAKKHIQKKAGFDIDFSDVNPSAVISKCKMPSMFIHGKKDNIVPINHSRNLFKDYGGPTKIHELEIDHNDPRPKWVKHEIRSFFQHKFAEAKKKREITSHIPDILKEKVDHEDIDLKRAQDIMKKVGFSIGLPSTHNKENSSEDNNKPTLFDPLQKNIIYNPLAAGLIKPTIPTTMHQFKYDQGSDSEGEGPINIQKFIRPPVNKPNFKKRVDTDSDDDGPPVGHYLKKGAAASAFDSDDSGDEGYPGGIRDTNRGQMSDFFKFQQKKMGMLSKKFGGRGRGTSFDGKDDKNELPKGYNTKMVAPAYSSDTEQ